jgi:hypothetical protein
MLKSKPILIELAWLLLAAAITLALSALLFREQVFEKTIDINLYDTYFVIPTKVILIPLLINTGFIIFYSKERKHSFSRKAQNIITLVLGLLLLVALAYLNHFISIFMMQDLTIAPPLNNPLNPEPVQDVNLSGNIVLRTIIILQVAIVLLLIRLAYSWGKSFNSQSGG